MKKLLLILPMVAVVFTLGGASMCHSNQFYLAKKKLNKLMLTGAQKKAVLAYEKDFQKKWNKTHRRLGCSHHEAHADEFIAAASGVLTDDQFRKFANRRRNALEKVEHKSYKTGEYIDNLMKLAKRL